MGSLMWSQSRGGWSHPKASSLTCLAPGLGRLEQRGLEPGLPGSSLIFMWPPHVVSPAWGLLSRLPPYKVV